MQVASLFAALGFKVDQGSVNKANGAIQSMRGSLAGLATKVAIGFGFAEAIKSGLKFNATVEDSKNQIAGMLALSRKTDLSDEIGNADTLMANLQKRAATLPGTTQEYVQMLGSLTQPILDAGLGMQDLEDLTVNATVGAKALGVEAGAAARDIDQALRGQFHSTDVFTGKLLAGQGYKGEAGRAKFNAMSQAQRAEAIKNALTQKQLTQLAEAQGKSASGTWSTVADTLQQTLGKIAAPLFVKVVEKLKELNEWFDANKDKVERVAETVGTVLVGAFEGLIEVLTTVGGFLSDHQEVLIGLAALVAVVAAEMAASWIIATAPILAIIAAVVLLSLAVKKLAPVVIATAHKLWSGIKSVADKIVGAFVAVGSGIRNAFDVALNWVIEKVQWVERKIKGIVDGIRGIIDSIGGSVDVGGILDKAATVSPAEVAPGAGGGANVTTNNTQSIGTVTINVPPGTSPEEMKQMFEQHTAEHWDRQMRGAHADAGGADL